MPRAKYRQSSEDRRLTSNRRQRESYQRNKAAYDKNRVKWVNAHPSNTICTRIKHRSKAKGIPFSISPADIPIPAKCPILGMPLKFSLAVGGKSMPRQNSPSVDRIDPKKGYVPGNVRVISFLANAMKQNATPKQLLDFANFIIREQSNGQ